MIQYYTPVVIVVIVNALYHVCAKAMPPGANPLALLVVTYVIGAATALILFMATDQSHNFIANVKQMNWAPILLGFCVVGLEFGFILLYRVGWNIGLASLVCNIALAIVLISLGLLVYKEHMSGNQMIGIVLCIAGLIFINRS